MKRLAIFAAAVCLAAVAATSRAEGVRIRVLTGIYADAQDIGLKSPEGVAAPSTARIVVADTGNGRLVEFEVTAEAVVAKSSIAFPELPYPIRLAGRANGDMFVLDGKARRIGRVAAGAFAGWVDPVADGDIAPRALRVDASGNLWILDVAAPRVLVLGADNKLLRTVKLPATPAKPGAPGPFYSDLAVDSRGNLFVVESIGRRVFVVRSGSPDAVPFGASLEKELDFANALAVDAAGRVFIADQNGGGIVVLGVDGSFQGRQSGPGWKEGLLRYPSALAIDPSGRLLVADRGNNRIAMFGLVE